MMKLTRKSSRLHRHRLQTLACIDAFMRADAAQRPILLLQIRGLQDKLPTFSPVSDVDRVHPLAWTDSWSPPQDM
jgi:hypothetical protein